jgi:hypothetical protein
MSESKHDSVTSTMVHDSKEETKPALIDVTKSYIHRTWEVEQYGSVVIHGMYGPPKDVSMDKPSCKCIPRFNKRMQTYFLIHRPECAEYLAIHSRLSVIGITILHSIKSTDHVALRKAREINYIGVEVTSNGMPIH